MGCSPVFRDLIECCYQMPTLDGSKQLDSRNSRSDVLEMPLEDPDEEIAALVEHLHRPERFLESAVPILTKEGSDRILILAPMAFKYDMEGDIKYQL